MTARIDVPENAIALFRRPFPPLLAALFFVLPVLVPGNSLFPEMRGWKSTCGQRCIYVCLRVLGTPVSTEEISSFGLCESFLDMANVARGRGVIAKGWKAKYDELLSLSSPFIVRIRGDHFVVVDRIESELVSIIDPPSYPRMLSRKEFERIWDGYALTFQKEAPVEGTVAPCSGPAVRFDTLIRNLGVVRPGGRVRCEIGVRNEGDASLTIQLAAFDSAMEVSGFPESHLPPRGMATFFVESMPPNDVMGWQSFPLVIATNDPFFPEVSLRFFLETPSPFSCAPSRLDFGEIVRGKSALRLLLVTGAFLDGETNSLHVLDESGTLDIRTTRMGAMAESIGSQKYRPDTPVIHLTPRSHLPTGKRGGTVRVMDETGAAIEVPYAFEMVSRWFVIPSRLYLAPGVETMEAVVRARDGGVVPGVEFLCPPTVRGRIKSRDAEHVRLEFRRSGVAAVSPAQSDGDPKTIRLRLLDGDIEELEIPLAVR